MGKKNIVIVGGGGAGVNAARTLSRSLDASKYQLILINPLPYRVWLIATLRLTVSPQEGLKEEMMLPYDKVFAKGNGTFVEGTVASFKASEEGGGTVTLESGENIEYVAFRFFFTFRASCSRRGNISSYHVLLLAQGATWSGPPGLPRTENGVKEHVDSLRAQFGAAHNIVIVGGGAVGYGSFSIFTFLF